MSEALGVKVGRLDERLKAIEAKVDANARLAEINDRRAQANDETARQHNTEVLAKLAALISISDEWRGARKLLAAAGTMLLAVGALAGAFLHYLSRR
ncbi:MAG: hypothetical protein WAU78_16480 [Roseiarcus sp.]